MPITRPQMSIVGTKAPGGSCSPSVSATAMIVWPTHACTATSPATRTSLAKIQTVNTSRRKISVGPRAMARTAAGVITQT